MGQVHVWHSFEDISWVPNNHILCKIDSPSTKTDRSDVVSEADIIFCPKLTKPFAK